MLAKKFWPLFWTQFLGALNDNVMKNAMVVMITYKSLSVWGLDSASIVALSGGIFILPFFIFSMAAGQITDKHEKSQIVKLVKIWELLITIVASIGFFHHNVAWLLGALFMMGTHSAFFGPVKYSSLPQLVEKDQLVRATAYVEVGTVFAILLGTILGGFLIAMPSGELYAAAGINIFALMGIFTGWRVSQLPSAAKDLKISLNPIAPLKETIRLLNGKRDVLSAIIANSWFWLFGAAVLSVLPSYCKDFLRIDERGITAFLALWTIGTGVGAVLCDRLSRKIAYLGLVPIGAAGLSLFLFDLSRFTAQTQSGLITITQFLSTAEGFHQMADFFLMAVSGGLFVVPLYTAMQERCEGLYRSRVIAGNNVFNALFMVVAAVAIMVFHQTGISLPTTFFIISIANVLVCALIFFATPEYLASLTAKR